MPIRASSVEEYLRMGDAESLRLLLPGAQPEIILGYASQLGQTRNAAKLLIAASRSAEPTRAAERLLLLASALKDGVKRWHADGRRGLAIALGGSDAVARYATAKPSLCIPIVRGQHLRRAKTLKQMRDELRAHRAQARDDAHFDALLRLYRVREWIRIVVRELARFAGVEEILAELSDLAEAIIDCTTRYHLRRDRSIHGARLEQVDGRIRHAGLAVIAQGKLGSRDLNLSSDVDIQFIYSSDDGIVGAEGDLHSRQLRVARQIVHSLSRRTAEGMCYRVDVDLRPEGTKGALANSLPAIERYYETWGQSWERIALIRARHIGGSAWVSRAFRQLVRPFVFPRNIDERIVDEIRALKNRLHAETLANASNRNKGIDIKRDPGCIREIELFVQIMQVLHGGRHLVLRNPRLLPAMDSLHFLGLLSAQQKDSLTHAYIALRRLENCLQAVDERQTHRLPTETAQVDHVARLFGMRSRHGAGKRLASAVALQRRAVEAATASPIRHGTEQRLGRPTRPQR